MNKRRLLTDRQIARRKIIAIGLIGLGLSHPWLLDRLLSVLLGNSTMSYYMTILLPYLFVLAGFWIARCIVQSPKTKIFFKRAIIAYSLLMIYVFIFNIAHPQFDDNTFGMYYMINDTFEHLGVLCVCLYLFRSVTTLGSKSNDPHIQQGVRLIQDAMVIMLLAIAPALIRVNSVLYHMICAQEILIKWMLIPVVVMMMRGLAKLCSSKVTESGTESVIAERCSRFFSAPICGMLTVLLLYWGVILCPYILYFVL